MSSIKLNEKRKEINEIVEMLEKLTNDEKQLAKGVIIGLNLSKENKKVS